MKLIANELGGSSKLVRDYIRSDNFAARFLPNNTRHDDKHFFDAILKSKGDYSRLRAVCKSTMQNLPLNELQSENLEKLCSGKALAVVTGQQPGLFGGPIYSLTKAFSAFDYARKMKIKHPEYDFVPVYWVADNDHDAEEAGNATIFDSNLSIVNLSADYDSENISIANRFFGDDITGLKEQVADAIKNTQYADEIIKMLDDSYVVGKSWSGAFVKFINYFLAECGFVFISAEKFREYGLFEKFAEKELNNTGQTANIVNQTNDELLSLGYHLQAQVFDINLFYHRNNIRENITSENLDDYKQLFKENPNLFSPKVLLRPLMQDAILPTAAYIAGPGELAYLAQLNKLYNYYNIIMPRIILRHSFTILDNRSLRFIEKYDINPEIFKSHQDEFMQIIPKYIFSDEAELAFLNAELTLKQIYDELSGHIIKIDKNLEKSMASAYTKSAEQLTHIRKKAITSQKKSNEEFIDRFMQIRNLILPNGKLQERVFGIINFVAIAGIDEIKQNLSNLSKI
ncbi:MAG: bacillithiol biosynthesis cysteine-adding enzyme BshC [Candidatus Kapabacteria bacterium]|nr:bacillithiol biosynthesis cysteine-adding enzyme BshC [Candidatus Kapabacteria bacterium]